MSVAIFAGGTGGHVYPAATIAKQLLAHGHEVHWFGRGIGLESRVGPQTGACYHSISATGIRGHGGLKAAVAFCALTLSILRMVLLLRNVRVQTAIGFGGFVSVPGGVAAGLLRIPLLVHEQNARIGSANRLLGRWAKKVLCGIEQFQDKRYSDKKQTVGNPVREIFGASQVASRGLRDGSHPVRLLIFGGSQGATFLNDILPSALEKTKSWATPLEVLHISGEAKLKQVQDAYERAGLTDVRVQSWSDKLHENMAWADLAVCRAGAMTIAELQAVGLGAVLVPIARSIDDHQLINALQTAADGGVRVLQEKDCSAQALADLLADLSAQDEDGKRPQLLDLAQKMQSLGQKNISASKQILSCLEEAAGVVA